MRVPGLGGQIPSPQTCSVGAGFWPWSTSEQLKHPRDPVPLGYSTSVSWYTDIPNPTHLLLPPCPLHPLALQVSILQPALTFNKIILGYPKI